MTSVRVDPRALRPSRLQAPPSKSDALRRLALGYALGLRAEAGDEDALDDATTPEDILVLERGLEKLREPGATIDCHDGAAPLRFLLALAAVTPGADVSFTGSARLGQRPHAPLLESLRRALGPFGAQIDEGGGGGRGEGRGAPWPLRVRGVPESPAARDVVFEAPVERSSQFASALLLAATALSRRSGQPCRVKLVGEATSAGYLELTCDWLRAAGVSLTRADDAIAVEASHPRDALPPVPADWSSLAYLLVIGWKLGLPVHGADVEARHPDRAILERLRECGLTIEHDPAHRTLQVTGVAQRALDASARETPDLIPTLAALAAALPAPSTFRDVSVLRLKESDRVEGIRQLLAAFGGETSLEGEVLRVFPLTTPPREVAWQALGDHRRAMTASVLSVLTGSPVVIHGAETVRKSFPGFFDVLGAGAQVR